MCWHWAEPFAANPLETLQSSPTLVSTGQKRKSRHSEGALCTPEGQSLCSNPGTNPGLSSPGLLVLGPPPPRMAVTMAGLGRLCGNHFSSPTHAQAPCRRAHEIHFQLFLHPVENLVEPLLEHLALLCQLGSLHGGAGVLQHLQDPLLKVWERREGQGRTECPTSELGLEAGGGRPTWEGPGQSPEETPVQ